MKYLLLGGAGFIGQNLAKRLIKTNNEVTIIDSLFTSLLWRFVRTGDDMQMSFIFQVQAVEGNPQ